MEKVLLTGATGFLGKYILEHFLEKGYDVDTLSKSGQADISCDLGNQTPVFTNHYNWVIHAAGKAHSVPKTEAEKQAFFEVNLEGTKRLCKGLSTGKKLPSVFIFISTVSVYGIEKGNRISEDHALNGDTPYALSKIQAEQYLQQWCSENGVNLAILRLPLIAGTNAPGNLGAMVKAIQSGRYFNIGKGTAKKSIVLAGDVAAAIPLMAGLNDIFNLTDGYHPSIGELANYIAGKLQKSMPRSLPAWVAYLAAIAGNFLGSKAPINSSRLQKITATLTFDDQKARQAFGWNPQPVLQGYIP